MIIGNLIRSDKHEPVRRVGSLLSAGFLQMIPVIVMHDSCMMNKDWGISVGLEGMGMHYSAISAYASKRCILPEDINQ